MSIVKYGIDGYSVLELNHVAFRRDGRIEAQCALDTASFSSTVPAENGMLLAVDKVNGKVKMPTDGSLPIAINYSTEHLYDERHPELNSFALVPGEFFPRLGYLSVGDTFTTNCLAYDDASYTNDAAVDTALAACATTAVYGGACENGRICLSASEPSYGPKLKVVKDYTMPDGQHGVKFQVIG